MANTNNAISEYKHFILTYLLPIIGISQNNNLSLVAQEPPITINNQFIRQEKDIVFFSFQDRDVFSLKLKQELPKDSIALARKIIPAFFSVSKFKSSGSATSPNITYPTDEIYEENIKLGKR